MHYKALFVSDIHLGTPQCQVSYLLDFFHDHLFDEVYLLGDIFDLLALRRNWYWKPEFNTFIQKVLRMARKGAKVIYIPGNHDIAVRKFLNSYDEFPYFLEVGNISLYSFYIYETHSYKILLTHGDVYDGLFMSFPFFYHLGDLAYSAALRFNTAFNFVRKSLGFPYWSLSSYLKRKVKYTFQFLESVEQIILSDLSQKNCVGIIHGHTHTPTLRFQTYQNKTYLFANTGDVVESLTCIVETPTSLQLIYLPEQKILSEIHFSQLSQLKTSHF
ncbi:MAG: UDP-2,3-diacylglucosamine diphosphatase [Candidatus Dojkabacteria bacterium]|nr:UDP-2,3-diacylglucosamine diphosphatase [Candidatus Dojkabacteria bacterium]